MITTQTSLEKLQLEEEELARETELIKKMEQRIAADEKRILHEEKMVESTLKASGIAGDLGMTTIFGRTQKLRNIFIKRVSKHKFITTLLVTTGIVLVWRGIWHLADETPILSIAAVSFVVGILILWVIDRFTELR
ncbi:hypothetical protein HGA88_01895 [Candidatus Roizmanbacteria bacterium]|nr:hypothetical protein [Candidatus Roizmanbacteria bacterium]